MRKSERIGTGFLVGVLTFIVAIVVGWVMNIVNICQLDSLELKGEIILQVVGIFVIPLGSVMGFIL